LFFNFFSPVLGFELAPRQELHHLSHGTSPFFCLIFLFLCSALLSSDFIEEKT
jgi:hypothetical protein